MCTDCDRLKFVKQRDGSATEFARHCVKVYRRACLSVKKGRRVWSREFRAKFAQGYLVSKRYLKTENVV